MPIDLDRAEAAAIPNTADRDAFFDRLADPELTLTNFLTGQASSTPFSSTPPSGLGEAVVTVLAGRYKLMAVVGEGGMGGVYKAEQTEPAWRMSVPLW
jgi:hypothetical protein